ncbi:FecR domain-containing protein [Ancylomarina sp. DW003]|nr:FecR domain-containing protein [Ancylomarina sp. DW003]MDE5421959.1 FecR domain-containing protein [Ancylomarina sp. DW003]
MKEIFQIAKLISKEKFGDLSAEERRELDVWLTKNGRNSLAYKQATSPDLIKNEHELFEKLDVDKSWKKLTKKAPSLLNRKVIRMKTVLRWVAALLLPLLATTYLVNDIYWNPETVIVEAGGAKATLQLANGELIYLEDFQNKEIKSGKEKLALNSDNKLAYHEGESQSEELKYNTIHTPTKGEYSLVLSDGTKVWLNAQTQLEYPVKFGKGKREVILNGEAYFDVAHDTTKAFIVHIANGADVEVLGTSFNVMAYEDEAEVQTTLVEGKVKFTYQENQVTLTPGEQSGLNRKTSHLDVREVKTYQYSAWKEGKFVFSREPLSSVFRKVSRWYGVEVVCEDEVILNRRISGVMNKYENVGELIDLIEEVSPLKIEINKDKLLVSKKMNE